MHTYLHIYLYIYLDSQVQYAVYDALIGIHIYEYVCIYT
jgi:hypothetical protein